LNTTSPRRSSFDFDGQLANWSGSPQARLAAEIFDHAIATGVELDVAELGALRFLYCTAGDAPISQAILCVKAKNYVEAQERLMRKEFWTRSWSYKLSYASNLVQCLFFARISFRTFKAALREPRPCVPNRKLGSGFTVICPDMNEIMFG